MRGGDVQPTREKWTKGAIVRVMSRISMITTLVVVLVMACLVLVVQSALRHRSGSDASSEAKALSRGSVIVVVPLDDPPGPRMIVAVANESRATIYLARRTGDLCADDDNPLRARVVDVASGNEMETKYFRTLMRRAPREGDFVPVAPGYCYGLELDLRDFYTLGHGRRYRVVFRYSLRRPREVGHIKPWKGLARSKAVLITAP